MKKVKIVSLFEDVVRKVSDHFDYDVLFMAGSQIEITNSLTELSKSATYAEKRYPGIFLFLPFTESNKPKSDFTSVNDFQLLIAINTLPDLSTTDRYLRNFDPYLYPIFDAFLHEISRNTNFREANVEQIEYESRDWPYYGNNGTENIFNDFIDCIELKNLKLNVKRNYKQ